jgi:cation transport regulator ChaB
MRVVQQVQIKLGEIDISNIWIDPKCRDDIPQILRGLQHVYKDTQTKDAIFKLLEQEILSTKDKKNGRPGMTLWSIFILGILRVNLNIDYDKLHELVNNHLSIRQMLGHPNFSDRYYYHHQTLKDNVQLITPELLDKVNQIVVKAGYRLIKKKLEEPLHGRCDSFVVETNVHFPTDINLLLDAMRKIITLTSDLCEGRNMSNWRQSKYNLRHVKRLMRSAQNAKHHNSKDTEKRKQCESKIKAAHQEYIAVSNQYILKSEETLQLLDCPSFKESFKIEEIRRFIDHGKRQIDQIQKRVILGETIPHDEKVFSLFKPYTEWVSKGKAGVPVELGVKVCILEDENQFILHHSIMEKQTDDQVAIAMVEGAEKNFGKLSSVSFDKGFHSKNNQEILKEKLNSAKVISVVDSITRTLGCGSDSLPTLRQEIYRIF